MTTGELLRGAWDWEPSVIIGCAALAAVYLVFARGRSRMQAICFLAGTLLLLLDLVSPLDTLGDSYLFSAHVAQHFILALIVPPLWLLGMPRRAAKAALRYRSIRRTERVLAWPPGAWLAGVGAMLLWHFPPLFNAALADNALHVAQHLSFLITGAIFWWPICGPLAERRLSIMPAIVYLFSACTVCSLLGAALTFSAPGAYPVYLQPADRLGILPLIRSWGLDPKSDQQLGGMLMWVPGCLVYLTAILVRVGEWYRVPQPAVIDPA